MVKMTLRFLLLCFFVDSVVHSQLLGHREYHPGFHYGHRPAQPQMSERVDAMEEEKPKTESAVDMNSIASPKVFIRMASEIKPTEKKVSNVQSYSEGCKCEPLDECPVEKMDFTFGVSCPFKTVRCCRPVQPIVESEPKITTTEEAVKGIDIVTPVSVLQMPTTTPISVTERPAQETEILGNSQFRPVNLPFMKVPASFENEHPPVPTFQRNPPLPAQFQVFPTNAVPVLNRFPQPFLNHPGRFQQPMPLQHSVTPTSFPIQQHQAMIFQHQQPGQRNPLPTASQPFIGNNHNIQHPQQFQRPPPPPSPAVMSTLFQQQQRQPQQKQSSGNNGFLGSLMNMFS